MKRIVFRKHADWRMTQRRQDGITYGDVYAACHLAKEVLYKGVPDKIKLKGFFSKSGVEFDIVIVDSPNENILDIVTVIGKGNKQRKPDKDPVYTSYKSRKRLLKEQKKRERRWI